MDTNNKTTVERLALSLLGVYLFVLPLPWVISIREGSLFLAIFLIAVSWFKERRWEWPPLKILLLIWIGLAVLSLAASDNVSMSLSEIKKDIIYPVMAFWLSYVLVRNRSDFVFMSFFILVSASLTILASIYMYYYIGLDSTQIPQTGYLYSQREYYSFFMLSAAAVGVAVAMSKETKTVLKGYAVALIPLCVLGVYFTRLRSGYLAIIASFCMFLIYTNVVKKTGIRRTVILTVMLLVIFTVPLTIAHQGEWIFKVNPQNTKASFSILMKEGRLTLWKDSIKEILKKPVLGKGFGNKSLKTDAFPGHTSAFPHNIFLSYGTMTGVGGAILLLVIFGRLFLLLHSKTIGFLGVDRTCFGISLSGVLLLVVFVLVNLTSDVMTRHSGQLFWALMGMTLGSCRTARGSASPPVRTRPVS